MGFLDNLFNMADKRELKGFEKIADQIDAMEPKFEAMTNKELKSMTNTFKDRLAKGETLDDILPEAFATVREASKRVLGMRHYKVQLIGGMVLHQGRIAEMKTGEGKTLVATAPVYLNALEGKGVHVVTVNDYLAKRDKEEMGKVYEFLGLTVGVIVHGQSPEERRKQYECDITYGTNNEYGFDYLKDNMVIHKEQRVQRELNYAIVDEVDSILIDEARTPLIISGPGDKSTHLYTDANTFVLTLKRPSKTQQEKTEEEKELPSDGDYEIDEKQKAVSLSESGIKKAELYFNVENITDVEHTELFHHINQALKAHAIMKKDVDYVSKDGEIVIVDEFTGRLMFGRRYSEGLHQAIEAKEGLHVQRESKTLATITFQNFFRMYSKLAGMTGTAKTEEEEFKSIYKMDVVQIPTNKPILRQDLPDVVYKNERGKFNAVAEDILERHAKNQPVLVGTVSIEKSELLSQILKRKGIKHEVLNAKNHEKAKDIRDKYIDPPNTTDFGLMFLPTEGIYAEVLKNQNLVELIQREYKVNITGPTTLVALLNSLQMGFRSLAIEKHSSEVWKILGAVKTEFSKFETVLNSAQNKLNQASSEIDKLVGTRTRQINRKLKNIDKLSFEDTDAYLPQEDSEDEEI